MRLTISYPVT